MVIELVAVLCCVAAFAELMRTLDGEQGSLGLNCSWNYSWPPEVNFLANSSSNPDSDSSHCISIFLKAGKLLERLADGLL